MPLNREKGLPPQGKEEGAGGMNKELEAKRRRLPPGLGAGLMVGLFFGVSLFIRAYLPYDHVFSGEWIKFTSVDAYFQMRLVDNLIPNFPRLMDFDPYLLYPFGMPIDNIHFFNWLLAGVTWVIGLGSPSQHLVDSVGAYFPAVLAALTVIPVYFIGKELFGRWAGVLSAGLVALLPGEFLGRSILGFTDHHIAEVLFTTTAMMFLIWAVKASREKGLNWSHLRSPDWTLLGKPIIYSLLAGLFLGLYLITWIGGPLFLFIIALYFVVQFIIAHQRGESADYLIPVGIITFLTALIIYLPFSRKALTAMALSVALLAPALLSFASHRMRAWGIKPAYYPLALAGLGAVAVAVIYIVSPSMLDSFQIFTWSGSRTILEMQPLLAPRGEFTLGLAWGNFNTSFFLGLISLGILLYLVIKHGDAEKNLLVVWSVVILLATLGQRRFAYYFAVNAALLTGYLSWQFLKLAGFKESAPATATSPQQQAKAKKTRVRLTTRHLNMALGVVIIFFIVFFPNIGPSVRVASHPQFAPDDAWISSLVWLKENTPEPFGDSDFYYQRYQAPPPEERYPYPESAYGVMAWVDYGYWIARIAHRPVNLTPGPGGFYVATFLLSQDEDSTQETKWVNRWEKEIIPEKEIIEKLGSAYIIIDQQTATSKFWALASWAKKEPGEFFDIYYVPQGNQLMAIRLFHPAYYRSLLVRLYNFDGQAVTPEQSIVISYEEKMAPDGKLIKVLTDVQNFLSYEEAKAYIASQKSGNHRIVSDSPFISPVPLEALKHYQLIYRSKESLPQPGVGDVPTVKIFKYLK